MPELQPVTPLTCPHCEGKRFVRTVGLQHTGGLVETPGEYICHNCGMPVDVSSMLRGVEIKRLEGEIREKRKALQASMRSGSGAQSPAS